MGDPRVLVVEDEPDILELIAYNLKQAGFDVEPVTSGEEALKRVYRRSPDAIVLDLMLPGLDGIEVCRRLKSDPALRALPVLILTARTEDSDIVAGLEIGADDYITKPFSPRVLIARVRSAIRRAAEAGASGGPEEPPAGALADRETAGAGPSARGRARGADAPITVHNLVIDPVRHEVTCGARRVALSATEFALLTLLARHPGWVFSRSRIIDAVRGDDYPVTERSVDVQILGLRRKLGEHGGLIQTVRGVGYRLQDE